MRFFLSSRIAVALAVAVTIGAILAATAAFGSGGHPAAKLPAKDKKAIESLIAGYLKRHPVKAKAGSPGPKGTPGAAGVAGPAGAPGPSEAIVATQSETISFTGFKDLASITLPAGSWIVTAQFNAANTTATPVRIDCRLLDPSAELDFYKVRLAANNGAAADLIFASGTLTGATTLASGGVVRLNCNTVESASPVQVLGGRHIIAQRVGSLSTQ